MFEHRHRLAQPGDEPNAEPAEGGLEIDEALALESRVARITLGLRKHLGLVEKHGEHGSAPRSGHGLGKCRMIGHPQVTLQPHTNRHWIIDHRDTKWDTLHRPPLQCRRVAAGVDLTIPLDRQQQTAPASSR